MGRGRGRGRGRGAGAGSVGRVKEGGVRAGRARGVRGLRMAAAEHTGLRP